jgi:phage terminase small subunit
MAVDRKKLTKRERLFVNAYDGDGIRSAMIAGYTGTDSYLKQKAASLLKNPIIIEALEYRRKEEEATQTLIANREERQKLWSAIMRNKDPYAKREVDKYGNTIEPENINVPLAVRMKAMEMLARSEGDFVDRVEVNNTLTIESEILKSYQIEQSSDDIEATFVQVEGSEKEETKEKIIDFGGLL